jgi:hypothetical protein
MATQPVQGGFLTQMGGRAAAAFNKHKNDQTRVGNAGLPEGIENGVARVIEVKIGQYKEGQNKGRPFFMARASVILPVTHNGIKVQGRQFSSPPEPLCETPGGTRKTIDEHLDYVMNFLRVLGVKTAGAEVKTDADLERWILASCAALTKQKPHVLYRTWKGRKATEGPYKDREPQVRADWLGVCEAPKDVGGAVQGTVDRGAPSANGAALTAAVADAEAEAAAGNGGDEDGGGAGGYTDAGDIDSLLELSQGDDDAAVEAQNKLIDAAVAASGRPRDEIETIETWAEIAAVARGEAGGGGEGTEAAAAGPVEPVKGEVYPYKPKGHRAPVDCSVFSVNAARKTVTLLNTKDKKTKYADVPWATILPTG